MGYYSHIEKLYNQYKNGYTNKCCYPKASVLREAMLWVILV